MKLTRQEKRKIKAYANTIYPLNLYVTDARHLETVNNVFDFYWTVSSWREGVKNDNKLLEDETTLGLTALVIEKNTGARGVLVVLENLDECSYKVQVDTISHESLHVTTAMCQYVGIPTPTYDEGDEHFAYLLGWVAGCIADAVVEFKKEKDEVN